VATCNCKYGAIALEGATAEAPGVAGISLEVSGVVYEKGNKPSEADPSANAAETLGAIRHFRERVGSIGADD